MPKRKKKASTNDTKVAAIVTGLFAAAVIICFIFSKANQPGREPAAHAVRPAVSAPQEEQRPVKPVKHYPSLQPATHPSMEKVPGTGGKIALIIDDWGQSTANCKYLEEIPEPIAVSILPGLRHSKDVAECAASNHKLPMLHLPLEALHNSDFYPPNYIIKTSMDPALASKIVEDDLDGLPSIEGVNNHMGSKATADRPLMRIILKKLKRRGLFFVDSMTARNSVCSSLAGEMKVPFGKRDIFLDNINTREEITKQILALAQKARHRGYAVAIGHDRHLTMQVLKEEIPWLEKQGFEIVSIKELLKK